MVAAEISAGEELEECLNIIRKGDSEGTGSLTPMDLSFWEASDLKPTVLWMQTYLLAAMLPRRAICIQVARLACGGNVGHNPPRKRCEERAKRS